MLTPQELDGTPIEFDKAGNPVIPEGYMKAPDGLRNFKGIGFSRGSTKWQGFGWWSGGHEAYFYAIPDPNYKKEEQPTPVVDPILAAFDGAIKDLQEELQDMKTAKEVYLRMSKDAEVFNAIAEKYGWYEEEEQQEVDQFPEPVEDITNKPVQYKDGALVIPKGYAVLSGGGDGWCHDKTLKNDQWSFGEAWTHEDFVVIRRIGEEQKVEQPPEPTELKVGDRVRVRLDAENIPAHDPKDIFVENMREYLGKEGVLGDHRNPGWFNLFCWSWSKNWLEKVKEET